MSRKSFLANVCLGKQSETRIAAESRAYDRLMRQLTSLDAQFLALKSSNQTGHVAGLAVLDPSTTASGDLTLADVCDRDQMPDPWSMLDRLRDSLEELG